MEENIDSNMDEEQPLPESKEKDKKFFYLFNCDKTYKLDAVEKLLNAIKHKHGFDISIARKKYFALFEMTELCKTIQSEPPMDFAVFVVHAHESRLSINEDNAGIGYARFYRALLEKTGNKVIVVIGGDDNYKNAAEEEKAVLSRWAKRQTSSQFKEEFMDGRISFIFSWDKKHRPIHEEAMLHYLDPGKKGEKFEPKLQPSKPAVHTIQEGTSNESPGADVNTNTPLNYSNLGSVKDESVKRQKAETERSQENVLVNQSVTSEKSNVVDPGKKGEKFDPKLQPSKPAIHSIQEVTSNDSPGTDVNTNSPMNYSNLESVKDESVKRQKAERGRSQENFLVNQSVTSEKSSVVDPGQVTPAGTSGHCVRFTPESTCIKHFSEALTKATPSQGRKTAILCRDQSDIPIISDLFGEEMLGIFHIFSGPPDAGPKSVLSMDSMWSCIIVVDARTLRDELCNKSARTPYKDLLDTAREIVERKVAIIICSDKGKVSQNEEEVLTHKLSLLLGAKGVILWWKENKNVPHQTQHPKPPKWPFVRSQSVPDDVAGKRSMALKAPPIDPQEFTLLLKTRLHRGKISYQKEDVEQQLEGWTAPEYLANDLMMKNQSTVDADLQIYQENGTNNFCVVVNDRKDSKSGNKVANSVKGAIDTVGELYHSARTELENVLYYIDRGVV